MFSGEMLRTLHAFGCIIEVSLMRLSGAKVIIPFNFVLIY